MATTDTTVELFDGEQSIDTSTDTMWHELQAACAKRDEVYQNWDEQLDRLAGPYFRGRGRDSSISPENPDYEWFALMRAQIVAGKPAWNVRQRRADVGRIEALSVRYGLDRWSVEVGLKRMLRKFFADWAFRKCVAYIRRVPAAGTDLGVIDGPAMKPQLLRISGKRYLYDPMAVEHEDCRWRGHETIVPLQFLLKQAKAADEDAGWRVDEIRKLQPSGDVSQLRPRNLRPTVQRDEVHVFEVWVPEEEIEGGEFTHEKGYHGVLHTYAATTSRSKTGKDKAGLVEIRDPQPYFGPSTGPYIVSGQEYVPDEIEPLSLFVATEANVRSFQRRARVLSDAIDSYKNVLLVGTTDSSLPQKIHSSRHRGVVPVKGYSKDQAAAFEIGGITPQLASQYQWDSDRIDRLRGLTDAMRGNVTGVATATENALAQSGAAARTNALRDVWYEFVGDIGRTVAWYMVEDDQSVVPLPAEMADMMGQPAVLVGGSGDGGVRFDDLEIDVEPLSMEYKSSQQLRAEADLRMQMLVGLGPVIVQNPWINWDQELTRYGFAYGDPMLREVVNYQLAGQIAGIMLGGQIMGAGQTGSPPSSEPKLAKDTPQGRQPVGGQARSAATGPAQAPKRAALPGQASGSAARKQARSAPGAR